MRTETDILRNQLTIDGIVERFGLSKASAYRLTRRQGWEHLSQPLEGGGRKKVFLVPVVDMPKETEKPRKSAPKKVVNREPVSVPAICRQDEDIPNLVPLHLIPEYELHRAQLKAELCEKVLQLISENGVQKTAIADVLAAYNSGLLVPDLYKLEGERNERTLRNWLKTYEESGRDFQSLVRMARVSNKMKATEQEQNFLLYMLLDSNKVKIGTAIRKLKQLSRVGVVESPTSVRALRRWCETWREQHIQQWSLLRKGGKFAKDNMLPTLLREEKLRVGDVWVADGHKLAFDIIDPATGRPKRMILLLFFDWGSRYPVGASIANTEDSEHILLALRNGILHWSGRPRFVYLDNGKAFKAKLFHDNWEKHDLENELCGVFPRLDIGVEFARAYNARAKVVERFFKTFQEDFERFMETFRGGSIEDRPAYLNRNEEWVRKLKKREALDIEQAKALIGFYFQELYGRTPHGGLHNQKPYELFKANPAPEDRRIDASELNFLMLKADSRKVGNNGIRLNNALYWHDEMVRHVGKRLRIRYDIMDMRSILLFDENERFICQAALRKLTHPFVQLAADEAVAEKDLKRQLAHQRKLESDVKTKSAILRKQVDEVVASMPLPQLPVVSGSFNNLPLLVQGETPSVHDEVAELVALHPDTADREPAEQDDPLKKLDSLFENLGL